MTPLFFGTGDTRLYGVFHPAQGRTTRNASVVICLPPQYHECVDSLRALRLLAGRLARQGYPVLRFDWFGTGDSAGEIEGASLERWVADIDDAVKTAKSESGVLRTVLVGVRFGATLAAQAAAARTDIDGVVLWEPIAHGAAFVDGLWEAHDAWLGEDARERPAAAAFGAGDEILGQALPSALEHEIRAIDLSRDEDPVSVPTLVLRNEPANDEAWTGRFSRIDVRTVDEAPMWAAHVGFDAAPLPAESLQAIQTWIGGLRR